MIMQDGPWSRYQKAPARTPGVITNPRPKPVDPMEAERLEMARQDQERQNRLAPIQEETARLSLQKAEREAAAGGRKLRPLPEASRAKLESNVGAYEAFKRGDQTFKDDYAGNLIGDLENFAQSLNSNIGTEGQRSWWSQFYATDQQIRNDLYGAALTPTEKASYDRTTINPRMDPAEIRKNLKERTEIVRRALTRQVGAYRANGFEPDAVDAAAGEYLNEFTPDYKPAPTPTDKLGTPMLDVGGDQAIVFGDENKPVTGIRYTPEQEAQLLQAIRDGDLGQALSLHQRFSGNMPTDETITRTREMIEALKKNPNTPIGVDYSGVDDAAISADERERFGDNLKPAMEARKDLVLDPIVRGVTDVVPFMDEISAGASTLFNGGTFGENVRRERAIDEADSRVNSNLRLAGQLGGAVVPIGRFAGFGRTAGARSAMSLGAEGGVLGGAYAAGKADPRPEGSWTDALAQRGQAGVAGAALGAATATGLGALANRMANRGGRTPPGGGVADAAKRQGIDLLPADVGGPVTKSSTAIARQGWLSEAPITRAADRIVLQTGKVRDEAAALAGNALAKDDAGEVVRKAANVYSKETSETGSALYTRADKMAGDTKAALNKAVAKADEFITELSETPGGSALLTELRALRNSMASGEFSIRGIRNMRTRLREEAEFKGLRGNDTNRRLTAIVDSAREDIVAALTAAGKLRAAKAFQTADDFWKARVETIDQVLEPVLGKNAPKSGEAIFQALEGMANKETGNSARLRRLMKAMPEDEARSVRATFIQRLGERKDGEFGFTDFVRRWDNLSAKAKTLMFPPESIKKLNDIATIAKEAKATAAYSNSSNTARAVVGQALFSGLVGGAMDIGTAGATAAGQVVMGRLLASPHFARFLARASKMADANEVIRGLSVVARRDPAIAQDALGLQRQLQQAFTQTPLRAAATDQEQQ